MNMELDPGFPTDGSSHEDENSTVGEASTHEKVQKVPEDNVEGFSSEQRELFDRIIENPNELNELPSLSPLTEDQQYDLAIKLCAQPRTVNGVQSEVTYTWTVTKNLEKFEKKDGRLLVALWKNGGYTPESLSDFQDLSGEVLNLLIEETANTKQMRTLLDNLGVFEDVSAETYIELARQSIRVGGYSTLAYEIDKFPPELQPDIIRMLIPLPPRGSDGNSGAHVVARYSLSKMQNITPTEAALLIVEQADIRDLYFTRDFDQEGHAQIDQEKLLAKMVELGQWRDIAYCVSYFNTISPDVIVHSVLEHVSKCGEEEAKNILETLSLNIEKISLGETARKELGDALSQGDTTKLLWAIGNGLKVSEDILNGLVDQLIEKDPGALRSFLLDKGNVQLDPIRLHALFSALTKKEGFDQWLLQDLHNFAETDRYEEVDRWIQGGYVEALLARPDNLGIPFIDLVNKIIDSNDSTNHERLLAVLSKDHWRLENDLGSELVLPERLVVLYLDREQTGESNAEEEEEYSHSDSLENAAWCLKFIPNPSGEIGERLAVAGCVEVIDNLARFPESDRESIAASAIIHTRSTSSRQIVEDIMANEELSTSINRKKLLLEILQRDQTDSIDTYADLLIDEEDSVKASSFRLSAGEFILAKHYGLITDENTLNSTEQVVDYLIEEGYGQWGDTANVVQPFQEGARVFGKQAMLNYIWRPNLSRHDALYAFPEIINLQATSGISPREFSESILQQVVMDDGHYQEGSAHHHLNTLAQRGVETPEDLRQRVQDDDVLRNEQRMVDLLEAFKGSKDVFSSWRTFKKYAELSYRLTSDVDSLRKIAILRGEGNEKLAEYFSKIAFHQGDSVNMRDLMTFVDDPESFLEASDLHAPSSVHERKKPSNYTEIPHLDLTAEGLRDALVEGSIDSLQSIAPFEVEYSISPPATIRSEAYESYSTYDLVKLALGSRRDNVRGYAKNVEKLFNELQRAINEDWQSQGGEGKISLVTHYLAPSEESTSQYKLSAETEKAIRELVVNSDFGMRKSEKTTTFRAMIHPKSSPEGVLAGNDTASCMPFGSGKNNVYMFNPGCAQFTLQKQSSEGEWRTVAQSVLTRDISVGKNISTLLQSVEESTGTLAEILPEDILLNGKQYIACDNVEVSPNFSDSNEGNLVAPLYQDFFAAYFQFLNDSSIDTAKIVVGQGYSKNISHLPHEENTYLPQAPMSYSDKTGEQVYVLAPQALSSANASREIKTEVRESSVPSNEKTGIVPLTFRDSLAVGFIEGKAYRDNSSLITHLHNMENGLIAKDIANVHHERPNLSVKYTDASGKMRGYLFAYEGSSAGDNGSNRWDYEDEPKQDEEKIIYISDLASDRDGGVTGGRLILSFLELYKTNYLDKGNALPIVCEAREGTSYELIKDHADDYARRLGVPIDISELNKYEVEQDKMHTLRIEVLKA